MIPLLGENGSRTKAAKILQGCYLHFHREKASGFEAARQRDSPLRTDLGNTTKVLSCETK
jgi:hypothetical protein